MSKMKAMDWFNIAGTTLGFIGSVIFSAALLKGPQQIKDETSFYLGNNPYISKNDVESQKYYRLAFGLLIAGFAIVVAGELRKIFDHYPVLIGILIALTLTSIGFLSAILLFNYRANKHLDLRREIKKNNFRSSIKRLKLDMKKEVNTNKTSEEYRDQTKLRFTSLKDTLSQIPTEHATKEGDLIRELEAAPSVQDMIDQISIFLNQKN